MGAICRTYGRNMSHLDSRKVAPRNVNHAIKKGLYTLYIRNKKGQAVLKNRLPFCLSAEKSPCERFRHLLLLADILTKAFRECGDHYEVGMRN